MDECKPLKSGRHGVTYDKKGGRGGNWQGLPLAHLSAQPEPFASVYRGASVEATANATVPRHNAAALRSKF